METQKFVKLLNDLHNELPKFSTKKWYVIHDQNSTDSGEGSKNGT